MAIHLAEEATCCSCSVENICAGQRRQERPGLPQLRSLISCEGPQREHLELALIRWYDVKDCNNLESELSMQKLQWSRKTTNREQQPWFDIIDVKSIQMPVFLQAHPIQIDTWFYNHFVWMLPKWCWSVVRCQLLICLLLLLWMTNDLRLMPLPRINFV